MKMRIKGTQPTYSDIGAAGMDIRASEEVVLYPHQITKVKTGLHVEIPRWHYGALVGRSGMAAKGILAHYGTIDESYRGEIAVILFNTTDDRYKVAVGDRVAQLIIQPYVRVDFEVVEELSETSRGEGGFGSSGK